MAAVAERVSVLETQVLNIDEKIDDIKTDVKSLDTKIGEHNTALQTQLKTMYDASCTQHAQLAAKISAMEKLKDKWTYSVLGGVAVLGWVSGHYEKILTFLK